MCCKTAQDHILCIDDVPVTDRITSFWTVCTHAFAYLLVEINDGAFVRRRGVRVPASGSGVKMALIRPYSSPWASRRATVFAALSNSSEYDG
jgi:hypothetical protein